MSRLDVSTTLPNNPAARVLLLAGRLRGRGVFVSPAEVADAIAGLIEAPSVWQRRATLQAALATALVKQQSDREVFDEEFDNVMRTGAPSPPRRDDHHQHPDHGANQSHVSAVQVASEVASFQSDAPDHDHGKQLDLERYFGESLGDGSHDHHGGDGLRLSFLGGAQTLDQAGPPPALRTGIAAFGLRRVASEGIPGRLSPPAPHTVPRDITLPHNGSPIGSSDEWARLAIPATETPMAEAIERWPTRLHGGSDRDVRPTPLHVRWSELTSADRSAIDASVRRIGKVWGGALGNRSPARSGRLDGRLTARTAMATGGVPFRPVSTARRDDAPRLLLLVDVSLSVRAAARYVLAVARAAQRRGGRVRTFVFVDTVAEVTREMAQGNESRALAAPFDGRVDVAAPSDGGAAFHDFVNRFGDAVGRRSTVLVLSDGRNNGRDPGLEALQAIRSRSARLVWLSPEPRGAWRLAGCDLPRYADRCDLLASAQNAAALERLARSIVRGRGRA